MSVADAEVRFFFGVKLGRHRGCRHAVAEVDGAALFPRFVPEVALDERLEQSAAALHKERLHPVAAKSIQQTVDVGKSLKTRLQGALIDTSQHAAQGRATGPMAYG